MRFRLAMALAFLALAAAGCRTKPKEETVHALIADLVSGQEMRSGAAGAQLVKIGEPAAPALAELLRTGDRRVRKIAAATLWGMGVKGRVAVPELTTCLDDQDYEIRAGSAMALQAIGPAAAPAVPALVRALKDHEGIVRQRAVMALGAIGPAASAALPALDEATKLDSVRPAAEEAMARIRGIPWPPPSPSP
jgi:HEAT repeat protein